MPKNMAFKMVKCNKEMVTITLTTITTTMTTVTMRVFLPINRNHILLMQPHTTKRIDIFWFGMCWSGCFMGNITWQQRHTNTNLFSCYNSSDNIRIHIFLSYSVIWSMQNIDSDFFFLCVNLFASFSVYP